MVNAVGSIEALMWEHVESDGNVSEIVQDFVSDSAFEILLRNGIQLNDEPEANPLSWIENYDGLLAALEYGGEIDSFQANTFRFRVRRVCAKVAAEGL